MRSDSPLMEASGLAFSRGGKEVFRGIDLALRGGERVALLGNNGAGKSTLLRVLAGVETRAHGQVRYGGVPLTGLGPLSRTRALAWMPQALWRDAHFTVRGFLALGAPGAARPDPREDSAGSRALVRLGVEGLLERPLSELSGGEWNRVRIAKALLPGADVLLLDEPSAGLDLRYVAALRRILVDQTRSADRAVVFSTHDLAFAAAAATHVLVIDEGRAVFHDTLGAFCRCDAASRLSGVRVLWQALPGEDGEEWHPHVSL